MCTENSLRDISRIHELWATFRISRGQFHTLAVKQFTIDIKPASILQNKPASFMKPACGPGGGFVPCNKLHCSGRTRCTVTFNGKTNPFTLGQFWTKIEPGRPR